MYDRCVIPRLHVLIGERTEKEEDANDNDDVNAAIEDIGKERKKRFKGRKRRSNAPPSKKRKQSVHDDVKFNPKVQNVDEGSNQEPKTESKAVPPNLFSIFTPASKFKNAPGKIVKRRARRVAASKLDSVGVRKLDKYFIITGKKDDATQKVLSDDSC